MLPETSAKLSLTRQRLTSKFPWIALSTLIVIGRSVCGDVSVRGTAYPDRRSLATKGHSETEHGNRPIDLPRSASEFDTLILLLITGNWKTYKASKPVCAVRPACLKYYLGALQTVCPSSIAASVGTAIRLFLVVLHITIASHMPVNETIVLFRSACYMMSKPKAWCDPSVTN